MTTKEIEEDHSPESLNVQPIYFDERNDRTNFVEKLEHGKFHKSVKLEEHISILTEPGSDYLCQVIPKTEDAKGICKAIVVYLEEKNIKTDSLIAIVSNGDAKKNW
jgi:hypothetical protein